MAGPMTGMRVVELGFWVAGPSAGGILADWGAEVVKIEPPDGDPFRGLYLSVSGVEVPANPPFTTGSDPCWTPLTLICTVWPGPAFWTVPATATVPLVTVLLLTGDVRVTSGVCCTVTVVVAIRVSAGPLAVSP